MAAFRFLALMTVGSVLLVLIFLLHAANGRMEQEATRILSGPEFELAAGTKSVWALDLGGERIEEAWPAPQRQPQLAVTSALGTQLEGVIVRAAASYIDDEGVRRPAFVSGTLKTEALAAPDDKGDLRIELGSLWLSYEHQLEIELEVVTAAGGTAVATLQGQPTENYIAGRAVARSLWLVFSIIGLFGFAGLMATQQNLFPDVRKPNG